VTEREIQKLENAFPEIAAVAFAEARELVLSSGQSVLQVEGSIIVEVFPDGRKEVVKMIEPPTYLEVGTKFVIE